MGDLYYVEIVGNKNEMVDEKHGPFGIFAASMLADQKNITINHQTHYVRLRKV